MSCDITVLFAQVERVLHVCGACLRSAVEDACARQKETPAEAGVVNSLEARPGFEPGIKALQASALPLGHLAI